MRHFTVFLAKAGLAFNNYDSFIKMGMFFQVWFQNRRAKLRREEKTKARPGRREKSQVEKTSVTLKILEVFDRDLTPSEDNTVVMSDEPSSPILENNEQPSLSSNSFSIESILSRKDPPQTKKQPALSENIGKSFRIEQLLDTARENQNKANEDNCNSLDPSAVTTTTSNETSNSESSGPEKEKSQDNRKDKSYEVSTTLAPFYVPLARHCGSHQSFPERYLHTEPMSSLDAEVFENFRSSSILRLRTKAEEHLRQLRVS